MGKGWYKSATRKVLKWLRYQFNYLPGWFYSFPYGQEEEDRWLAEHFKGHPPGFYVDVGCHHPVRFSNTYFLQKTGWTGLNIDADADAIKMFKKFRPLDTNVACGVGKFCRGATLYKFDDPALNTFVLDQALDVTGNTGYQIESTEEVTIYPLAYLLETYWPEDQPIHLLSIDVEGMSLEVLKSNDWDRYRPAVILVEDVEDPMAIAEFLGGLKYMIKIAYVRTSIYVYDEKIKLRPAPPAARQLIEG